MGFTVLDIATGVMTSFASALRLLVWLVLTDSVGHLDVARGDVLSDALASLPMTRRDGAVRFYRVFDALGRSVDPRNFSRELWAQAYAQVRASQASVGCPKHVSMSHTGPAMRLRDLRLLAGVAGISEHDFSDEELDCLYGVVVPKIRVRHKAAAYPDYAYDYTDTHRNSKHHRHDSWKSNKRANRQYMKHVVRNHADTGAFQTTDTVIGADTGSDA